MINWARGMVPIGMASDSMPLLPGSEIREILHHWGHATPDWIAREKEILRSCSRITGEDLNTRMTI
jgi:hypothetical protein